MTVKFRRAEASDVPEILEIYNEAILNGTATFDVEPKTLQDRLNWFQSRSDRHPVWVAEIDGLVVGWASISEYSDRQAYAGTVETSFYVKAEYRRRGIGRQLKKITIDEARRLGFHTILARIAEGSEESLHLNRSMGFRDVGVMKEVGFKFGRYIDVYLLQKMLKDPD